MQNLEPQIRILFFWMITTKNSPVFCGNHLEKRLNAVSLNVVFNYTKLILKVCHFKLFKKNLIQLAKEYITVNVTLNAIIFGHASE